MNALGNNKKLHFSYSVSKFYKLALQILISLRVNTYILVINVSKCVLSNFFAHLSKSSFKLQSNIPVYEARQTDSTCFSRYLQKGIDATLAIVAFRGQCGDVVPSHGLDNVHHGLRLVGVRRHHTGEELIAAFVTQLGGSGGVADLWDLKREDKSAAVKMSGQGGKKETQQPWTSERRQR